jgi:hypothetical protein
MRKLEKKMKRDSRETELVKEIREIDSEVGRLEGERQRGCSGGTTNPT